MKKTLAILLALAMVFSTMTVAFAEGTISADAQATVTLGMLKGEGNGVTADYLAKTPTRIQAAILFLRLKGLEGAATAFTGTDNFADAKDQAWAAPIMAYLKAHPELGWTGVGNNKFEPSTTITAQQYYKVMLEALGYKQNSTEVIGDFTYAGVIDFAAKQGLTKVATVTNFTNNDVAIATIEALKANMKGATKSLAASLVGAGILTAQIAQSAGVYTAAPVALAVESVSYTNLKELTVKFNKAVDKTTAETESNYGPAVDSATLQADGMTVKLVLTAAMANQEEVEFTVQNVKDANGVALAEKYTKKFIPFDATAPVAESITLVGPNKFEIKFSEPISAANSVNKDVEIADGLYGTSSITPDDTDTVLVELGASSLVAGSYKVVVSGYKDFAGLKALDKEFTLNYAVDTTAPVAKIKEAKQSYVTIEFNKPVVDENGDPLTVDYFYHTFTSYHPVDLEVTNNKTFKLIFSDTDPATTGVNRPLPEGNVTVVVDYNANDKEVQDEWGNSMGANAVLTAAVTADKTAPTVTKVEAGEAQNEIYIYFSEQVDQTAAEDTASYVVKNSDGDEIDLTGAVLGQDDDDNYFVTLTATEDLSGAYTIEVKDIPDMALEANEIAKVTVSVTVKDITPIDPTEVVAAGVDGTTVDYIYITFPEKMATSGEYSILNKNAYLIDGAKLGTNDKVETFGSTDRVRIVLADETAYDFTGGDDLDLTIGRVADESANAIDALAFVVSNVALETAPAVSEVNVLDYNKISFVVDKVLSTVTAAGIETKQAADATWNTLASIVSTTVKDGETTIVATLKSGAQLSTTDTSDADLQLRVVASKLKADYGMYVPAGNIAAGLVHEKRAPKLIATSPIVAGTAGKILVKFSEDLDNTNEALYAQDLVVTNADGDVLVAGIDYTTALDIADASILVVTLADGAGKYNIKSKDSVTYITDGNVKALPFTKVVTINVL